MPRITNNKNILTIGLTLLVILSVAAFLIGQAINRIVSQMNNTIITESCQNRYNEMLFEFGRTEQVGVVVCDFVANNDMPDDIAFRGIATTLFKLDPKVSGIWIKDAHNALIANVLRKENDIKQDSSLCWTLTYDVVGVDGKKYSVGIDIYLPSLYEYVAYQPTNAKSYVSLIDTAGVILLHPDSLMLGGKSADTTDAQACDQAIRSGARQQREVMSEYLGVPSERLYYPMEINDQKIVAVVTIPHMVINEEMSTFHRYTLLIMTIAVVLFSALLALSQASWKREYHLRRKAEQEALKMQLQQIVNQINPHFLFNSLNSLYVLVGKNTSLAREFVLSLSRVYRHVLEAGRVSLSRLDSEIDFMREYYFLQKIRFNEQIDLKIEIGKEFEAYKLPAMSVQTVVENAIKHNKITLDNPLTISIFTTAQRLIIENNYTPREDLEVESLGIGLERIRSIYKLYTQDEIVVSCDNRTYRCELPLLLQK